MGIRTLLCVLLRTSVLSQPNFLWQSPLVSQGPTPNREPKKNLAQHSHRANQTQIAQNRSQLRQSLSVPISVSLWFSVPPLCLFVILLFLPLSCLYLPLSVSLPISPLLLPLSSLFPISPVSLSVSLFLFLSVSLLCPLTPYSSYAEFPAL